MTSLFTRRTGLTLAALVALGLSSAAAQAQTFTSWTFNNLAVGTSLSPPPLSAPAPRLPSA